MYKAVIKKKLAYYLKNHEDEKERKLRDMLIGITLNIACNIFESKIANHLIVRLNILPVLLEILVDPRNDWPTHGSAQCLMQFSILAN